MVLIALDFATDPLNFDKILQKNKRKGEKKRWKRKWRRKRSKTSYKPYFGF